MHINVGKRDTVWSFLGTIFSMLANFIILPFVLHYLDEDSIGLYYIFLSLSSFASLFDFGFSPAISRSLAYAWSGAHVLKREGADSSHSDGPNYVLMKKVIYACRIIYICISTFVLLLSLSAGTVYIFVISGELQGTQHFIAWFIFAIGIFFHLLFGYYGVMLRGVGAVANVNKGTLIARVFQIILCIVLLVFGVGLIGVSIAYVAYGLLFQILCKKYFNKYKNVGANLKNTLIEKGEYKVKETIKIILPNTWREALVTISNYFLNQATTIIASFYLTLAETGVFSLSVQLASAVATIACTLYTTYQPSLQSAYVNKNVEMQKKNMAVIVLSFIVIDIVGTIFLMLLAKPVIDLFKPSYVINLLVLLALSIYQFMLKYRNCYCSYISTTNRLTYSYSFAISAVVCVGLSVLLCGPFNMGVWGLIWGQIISQAIFNVWYWPMKVHKELSLTPVYIVKTGTTEIINLFRRNNEKGINY